MKVFLLNVLVCLVSATEEPLPISGNFQTIYLASKSTRVMGKNSEFRMLMRQVKFFENYTLMSMTFYIKKNGKCQLHTVWADKFPFKFCTTLSFYDLANCFKNREDEFIVGTWVLRDATRHSDQIYTHPEIEGGRTRTSSNVYVLIHFVWNDTIIFETNFINKIGNTKILTGALARGTNITEEMWKEYVNLTRYYEIPVRNIQNVYEEDPCPKWKY